MGDDVLARLVDTAINDPEFRTKSQGDLEGTLKAYNFDLSEEELAAVREFHAETQGKSDQEIQDLLSGPARRQNTP